jgi:catechol 2,3-dioxygenase-like lactoylglutathione lyase family enzyme
VVRIDHLGLDVTDFERSKAFYVQALAPLGMTVLMEPVPEVCGFGGDFPFFWIGKQDRGPQTGVHVAFTAKDREMVGAFHAAALAAGGTDNGGPGVREYHPNYYGAFVLDPDGNNVEAVCHKPA